MPLFQALKVDNKSFKKELLHKFKNIFLSLSLSDIEAHFLRVPIETSQGEEFVLSIHPLQFGSHMLHEIVKIRIKLKVGETKICVSQHTSYIPRGQ